MNEAIAEDLAVNSDDERSKKRKRKKPKAKPAKQQNSDPEDNDYSVGEESSGEETDDSDIQEIITNVEVKSSLTRKMPRRSDPFNIVSGISSHQNRCGECEAEKGSGYPAATEEKAKISPFTGWFHIFVQSPSDVSPAHRSRRW
jgi:hypothetical protein